jgi:hypothetical protein
MLKQLHIYNGQRLHLFTSILEEVFRVALWEKKTISTTELKQLVCINHWWIVAH